MSQLRKISAAAAFVASLSMAAPQAVASEMPLASAPQISGQTSSIQDGFAVWDADELNAQNRPRRHRYRRNRVNAGDIFTGIAILGTIAAISNASRKRDRRRDERYQEQRYQKRNSDSGSDLQRATSACMQEIERNVRVDSVDAVNRNAQGWSVTGRLYDGQGFYCNVDSNGRVSDVNFGSQAAPYNSSENASSLEDRQLDDGQYREARRRAAANGNLPAPTPAPTDTQTYARAYSPDYSSTQVQTARNGDYASYPAAASQAVSDRVPDAVAERAAAAAATSQPAYPGGPVAGDFAYPEIAYSDDTDG